MSSLPEQTRLLPAIWLSCAIDARRNNLYALYLVTPQPFRADRAITDRYLHRESWRRLRARYSCIRSFSLGKEE